MSINELINMAEKVRRIYLFDYITGKYYRISKPSYVLALYDAGRNDSGQIAVIKDGYMYIN